MATNDESKSIHLKLLTDISDSMEVDSREYESFIEHMKSIIPKGVLASKKTLLKKLEAIAGKGKLGVGNYEHLKKIAKDSDNGELLEIISEAEQKIKALQTKAGSVPEAIPSSSGAQQETKNTKQEINDRRSPARNQNNFVEDDGGPSISKKRKLEDEDDQLFTERGGRQCYATEKKKGMLLILNSFENRAATQDDVSNLRKFFEGTLGFDIHDPREHVEEDLTTEETTRCLQGARDVLNGGLSKTYYCFICVILSHGSKDYIKTKDGMLKVEDIRMYFSNENMPNFAGRPKLFFVQSCRGSDITSSTEVDEDDDATKQQEEITEDESDVKMIKIPNEADTLMAYPTTTGNRSFRRVKGFRTGTWFIIECMEEFRKEWQNHHVEDMLITVREKVALGWSRADGAKQMPCVWSTLTKRLYLEKDNT